MRVIAPFDPSTTLRATLRSGSNDLLRLGDCYICNTIGFLAVGKFYFYEVKKKPQNFGYFLDFSELLVVCYLIMGYLQK